MMTRLTLADGSTELEFVVRGATDPGLRVFLTVDGDAQTLNLTPAQAAQLRAWLAAVLGD